MSTTETSRGLFITFEGIDGSGKTTQLTRLAARLRSRGYEVVETVEPGGTRTGSMIRNILLDPAHQELSATAELLLYFAARAQNVDETIVPALKRHAIVLSDRFTDSTLVYQGYGRGLGVEVVETLDRIACRGLKPDLTLYFDIDLATARLRAKARGVDRMDDQPADFRRRVREGYLDLSRREPRFRLIDGRNEIERVGSEVWSEVQVALESIAPAGSPGHL
ncbi:MAG: dTMP kinase [Bryobacterales bacterium]|nr:dTMP kinase [Bryobacterales bacterium]MEB2361834.1 dTMP kinase [Bryobacterales bacterium]